MVKIKAILFDLDGVLVDAKEWHYEAFNQALTDTGYEPIGREEHLSTYDGLPTLTKLQMLSDKGRFDMSDANKVYAFKQCNTRNFIRSKAKPNQTIIDTLRALKNCGYKLACCSNAIHDSVHLMLNKTWIEDYFDLILSNEDVDNPKPHPEMYLKAMEEFGVKPEECLIIEDNEKGFKVAIASGSKLMKVESSMDINYVYLTTEIYRNENIINVVIPMAGEGSRFRKEGYDVPKPFIDVDGQPMIKRVIDNLNIPNRRLIFIVRDEHYDEYIERLREIMDDNSIVITTSKTEGAASTVLQAHYLINNDDKFTIVNSDQIIFRKNCFEFGDQSAILTFFDDSGSKKWSYAKVMDGKVVSVREKVPISSYATVGLYYFAKGRYFVEAAMDMIISNDRYNDEFYVCPSFNYLIKRGRVVKSWLISNNAWVSLGTPELLKRYLKEKDKYD